MVDAGGDQASFPNRRRGSVVLYDEAQDLVYIADAVVHDDMSVRPASPCSHRLEVVFGVQVQGGRHSGVLASKPATCAPLKARETREGFLAMVV